MAETVQHILQNIFNILQNIFLHGLEQYVGEYIMTDFSFLGEMCKCHLEGKLINID